MTTKRREYTNPVKTNIDEKNNEMCFALVFPYFTILFYIIGYINAFLESPLLLLSPQSKAIKEWQRNDDKELWWMKMSIDLMCRLGWVKLCFHNFGATREQGFQEREWGVGERCNPLELSQVHTDIQDYLCITREWRNGNLENIILWSICCPSSNRFSLKLSPFFVRTVYVLCILLQPI